MNNEINQIRTLLDDLERKPNLIGITDRGVPEILKAILIDRFIRLGGEYNPEFVNYPEFGVHKKFFAFKENDITKLTVKEILERADRIEKLLKEVIKENNIPLDCMEFNFYKLENLRDREGFDDLIRGTFLYRRAL